LMLWTVSSTMDTVWTLMLSSCLAVWLHPWWSSRHFALGKSESMALSGT
jgi:hypothetical protein